eukprot:g28657.t1
MVKAVKNMASFFPSGETMDDEVYTVGHVPCLPSKEVVVIFHFADHLQDTAKQMMQWNYPTYMHTKNKKLEELGITTSSNQASPGTTVEISTTTGKSIVNLTDHTLQPDKIEVLSQGLDFCPTTKMDPIRLAADTEEFIRRKKLLEMFRKLQDCQQR